MFSVYFYASYSADADVEAAGGSAPHTRGPAALWILPEVPEQGQDGQAGGCAGAVFRAGML